MNWIQRSNVAHWRPILGYVAFAEVYVVFSTELVRMLPVGPSAKALLEVVKGLLFVAASAWAVHRILSRRSSGLDSVRNCLAAAQRAMASRPNDEERIALGALAHEMKNVVFVASLNAAFLESKSRTPEQHEQCTKDLRDAVARLTLLTRELSDRVGKTRAPAPQTFEVGALTQKCAETARMSVAGRSAEVEVHVRARGLVEGDKAQVEHALINLMMNAVQATEGSKAVRVTVEQRGDRVAVVVADQGPGLSEEAMASLFKPATHPSSGSPAESHRWGVGLLLTRRIARIHGGDVRLRSSNPHGAVFDLELPMCEGLPNKREWEV